MPSIGPGATRDGESILPSAESNGFLYLFFISDIRSFIIFLIIYHSRVRYGKAEIKYLMFLICFTLILLINNAILKLTGQY